MPTDPDDARDAALIDFPDRITRVSRLLSDVRTSPVPRCGEPGSKEEFHRLQLPPTGPPQCALCGSTLWVKP